jgi:hypothetical protein
LSALRLPATHTADLIGYSAGDLAASYGPPALRRRDGSAEVWLYVAGADCRLDLVLFQQDGETRVVHADWRMERGVAEATCLRRLREGGGS